MECGLTLTLFVLLDARADHIDPAVPTHDAAVLTHFLDGGTDFHGRAGSIVAAGGTPGCLFVAVSNTAAVQIIGRKFTGDTVAGENLDKMHTHLAGNVGQYFVAVLEHDAEGRIGETLLDDAVNLDCLIFGRTRSPLGSTRRIFDPPRSHHACA